MIDTIDLNLCDGCNVCIESCPTDVIRLLDVCKEGEKDTWKAVIMYPNDCHSCRLCAIDCHVDAIRVSHELHIPGAFLTLTDYSGSSGSS